MGYGDFIRGIRSRWEEKMQFHDGRPHRVAFAKIIGVAPETLSRWEHDRLSPSFEHLTAMLQMIDLGIEDCLFFPDEILRRDRALESWIKDLARDAGREAARQEISRAPPAKGKSKTG